MRKAFLLLNFLKEINTMSKKLNVINSVLLLLIVACSSLTVAVAQDAAKEIRIKIEKDVNGKKQSIDKTFTDSNDPELKKLLEEHNMDIENGEIDVDIMQKDKEDSNDKSATLKLKLDSDDEDQLNEFIEKIEQLAEDMDIDFSDIDIRKDDYNHMFKLFGDDFEDISPKLKQYKLKLDTMINLDGQDMNSYLEGINKKLQDLNLKNIDPQGNFYDLFDSDNAFANKAIMGVTIDDKDDGISIIGLNEGFGAEKAGLQEGDIITAIDNKTMKSADEVIDYISSFEPGDLVTVEYKRAGETNTTKVELMQSEAPKPRGFYDKGFSKLEGKPIMGVMIKDDGENVVINGVTSGFGAEKAGLKEGDMIISVDKKTINSVNELTDYLNELEVGDVVAIEYKRNDEIKKTEVELMKSGGDDYRFPRNLNWRDKFDNNEFRRNFDKNANFFNKNTRVMIMITDLDEGDEEKLNQFSPNSKLKLNDSELEQFEFFPNPSEGLFNLSFEVGERIDTEVNIYDLNGKIVYNKYLKNFMGEFNEAIDLQRSETGAYILEIVQGDKRTNKKIVVK